MMCVLFMFVEGQGELPESKYLRVENKVFYFDVGSNRRGVYLRISEVCLKSNHAYYTHIHTFVYLFHVKTCVGPGWLNELGSWIT